MAIVDLKSVTLDRIAAAHLRLDTLETRHSDSLDFRDQAVWSIKAALEAAYEAGMKAAPMSARDADAWGGQ